MKNIQKPKIQHEEQKSIMRDTEKNKTKQDYGCLVHAPV